MTEDLSVVQESLSLLLNSLLSSLSSSSVSGSSGLSLLLQRLLTSSLSLSLDDVLNQSSLVLEGVTLGRQVQAVVQVLVDLASISVLSQQSSQDSQSSHPDNLRGHTSILGTLSLTVTHVSTSSLGLGVSSSSRSGVDGHRLLHDGTVTVQLSDGLTRVGRSQLGGLVRVQPDLSLTNTDDTGSESLLSSKISPAKLVCERLDDACVLFCVKRIVDLRVGFLGYWRKSWGNIPGFELEANQIKRRMVFAGRHAPIDNWNTNN